VASEYVNWREVRREKALDFSGCKSRPGTGFAPPILHSSRTLRQKAEASETLIFLGQGTKYGLSASPS